MSAGEWLGLMCDLWRFEVSEFVSGTSSRNTDTEPDPDLDLRWRFSRSPPIGLSLATRSFNVARISLWPRAVP